MTMIVVTQEMRFAEEVTDKVASMEKGVVAECDSPTEMFHRPSQERRRAFLSRVSI